MVPPVVVLGPNQPASRFYSGGERIAAFRGLESAVPFTPEDWVGSVTTVSGDVAAGLSRLPNGVLLADAVGEDPLGWLGEEHVEAFGSDPALLVKLLDAGQRLPVHAHPSAAFAATHVGSPHGKTEAWIFLEPATVHLGFVRDISPDELAQWVHEQDVAAMLGAMHALEVDAGDAVLVPAGTPHAIGEGALLIELQEPTDLSILMEWKGFAIDGLASGHLGLGFARALGAVSRRGVSIVECESLRTASDETLGELFEQAGTFFRAERWRANAAWDAGYSVVIGIHGSATLTSTRGDVVELRSGMTVLTPHAAGDWVVSEASEFEAIRCRPPSARHP
jgi:mannose-6-phosphate isomerase